jgi:hypothetical protein
MSINVGLVVGSNGMIDDAKSLQAFESALAVFKAEREQDEEMISNAVAAQFDAYPGASQNLPALVHGVLNRLGATPANHKVLEQKVMDYVHANSDLPAKIDRKTKEVLQVAEEPRTRIFGIRKGAGGGVVRWSDQK